MPIYLGQTFEEWLEEDFDIKLIQYEPWGINWDDIPDEEDLYFYKGEMP